MIMQSYRWIRNAILVLGVGMLFLTHTSASQNAEREQADLAADLLSGDYRRVGAALNAIPIYPDPEGVPRYWVLEPGFTVGTPLVEALIEVLERETEQYARMYSGEPYEIMPGEMLLSILHTVIALNDPQAIPSLMRNAYTGWGVKNALLDFGPQIMEEAIGCANDFGLSLRTAGGCLSILEEIVKRWPDSLDGNTRGQITRVVLKHLMCQDTAYRNTRNSGRSSSLAWALRLAEILDAEELSGAITRLAEDNQDTWRACGFDKPHTGRQSEARLILEERVNQDDR